MKRNPTPRPTYSAAPAALPSDVRLMNLTAHALFVLVALALVVAAVLWAARHPLFAIRVIRVEGDVTRNSVATIRANAAPKLTGGFFTTKLAADKAAFEAVPWVRKAEVRREWPGTLVVRLEEHRAVALWGFEDADDKLVNSFGEVFEANQAEVESADLPQLNGPSGQTPLVLQAYRQLAAHFEKLDMQLERLDLTGQGSWRARLESGAVLELGHGSADEIEGRTQRFLATLNQVSSRYGRDLESADLRYGNGYALKLKGVTTLNPGDKDDKKAKR